MNQSKEILNWYLNGTKTGFINSHLFNNRSELNGRLASYETILKKIHKDECLYLILSSLGEVGNNCFDHNLGYWQDEPGCLLIRETNYAIICDRGRGIKQSLSSVYHLTKEDKNYISIAFTKIITGRAPEKRGNGLKFVRSNVLKCNLGLTCKSEGELIHFGKPKDQFSLELENINQLNSGVITYFYW